MVHVVCAQNPFAYTSYYTLDVANNPNIRIYTFKPFFPDALVLPVRGLVGRVCYHLWVNILRFWVKGYIYDRAIGSKRRVLRLAESIIRTNNIKNVIATGAPFRLNYYAALLKKSMPDIQLISDLRDPWMWGRSYSYQEMSERRKRYELQMQNAVTTGSDAITVPVDAMYDYLVSHYPSAAARVHKVPHAFDPDEVAVKREYRENSFRLVFYGTMYQRIDAYMETLARIMKKHPGAVTIDFFSDSARYKQVFDRNQVGQYVNYHAPLQAKKLFSKIVTFDYVLFIHPDYGINNISTKFYEVIQSRTPIIYIGESGAASRFITESGTGIHFAQADLESGLEALIAGKKFDYNAGYPVDAYSFERVTDQFIQLIK